MTHSLARLIGILVSPLVAIGSYSPETIGKADLGGHTDVFAGFDLGALETGPFPSDIFTVEDASHNTGRRLAHPYPNCALRPSDCDDLAVVNTLDGWGLQTRVSVPFSGDIDLTTVTSDTMFVVSLGSTLPGNPPGGERIGINQLVWDVATHTIHFEVDRLLDQHRRYAVIVTKDVLDTEGKKVKRMEAFENYATTAPAWYAAQLDEALAAAHAVGVPPGHVVTASVFTTQTVTSVWERVRDDIKAGTPAPADFLLGPLGERSVFARTSVASVDFLQHTTVSPPGFTPAPISLAALQFVPGAVGTIAYGRYSSPDYLVHPGEYIPAVGTLADTPAVTGTNQVYFTLYLPSGTKPTSGWPIAIIGGGASGNQHVSTTLLGSKLASHGIATIGINHVGQGFGPLGELVITKTDATTLTIPDAGRGFDQNGNNVYQPLEGAEAAAPRTWTISVRDAHRQTAIDFMQLVRVIEVGMDVDGDSVADIDPSRIFYLGASAGPLLGTQFAALDPSVSVVALLAAPGLLPEHVRWQPARRAAGLGVQLAARTPSLINSPGLTSIDGVAVASPHFNENKPLRDQPVVINTVSGAMELQQAFEWAEWVGETGISVTWAKYIQAEPLPGNDPKPLLIQMGRGDQQAVNPGTSQIVREAGVANNTLYYRHDIAFAVDPTIPKNPHVFGASPTSPNALVRAITAGVQDQLGTFFSSGGATSIHPTPTQYFEMPIAGPLPETLDFIP